MGGRRTVREKALRRKYKKEGFLYLAGFCVAVGLAYDGVALSVGSSSGAAARPALSVESRASSLAVATESGMARRLLGEADSHTTVGVGTAALFGGRALSHEDSSSDAKRKNPFYIPDAFIRKKSKGDQHGNSPFLIFHVLGVLYSFLGLMIVCDNFFGPALDCMVERWDIHDDVAGATFMAAGGSAPELSTALMGQFVTKSDIGFGTIVGSAVFNVLFVIGACSTCVPGGSVDLTWWPLFRDCSYYIFGLAVLSTFVITGPTYQDGQKPARNMDFYEAAILFSLYIIYVTIMYYNTRLEEFVKRHLRGFKSQAAVSPSDDDDDDDDRAREELRALSRAELAATEDAPSLLPHVKEEDEKEDARALTAAQGASSRDLSARGREEEEEGDERSTCVAEQSVVGSYYDGAADGITGNNTPKSLSSIHTHVTNLSADIDDDSDHDDRHMGKAGSCVSPDNLSASASSSTASPQRRPSRVGVVVLDELSAPVVTSATSPEGLPESGGGVESSSSSSPCEEEEDEWEDPWAWPDSHGEQLLFVVSLPLKAMLYATVPDCAHPDKKHWFLATFCLSLLWLAAYAYTMVVWTTIVGALVGVGDYVMGLTVLAAGTSIPDALSSMYMAREGRGDMAISSSIGSNVFDILVGLPVPVLAKFAVVAITGKGSGPWIFTSRPVDIFFDTCTLMAMVCLVVFSIAALGWKLNIKLGVLMFVLYFAFLTVSISVHSVDILP